MSDASRTSGDARATHFDVLVVGAGISGISAGYRLRTKCPDKTFVILEARDSLGGTWDLFRYPGIRSDSDMFTFGYSFKPWNNPKAFSDGKSILSYLKETASEFRIDQHIRFRQRAKRASWSSEQALWTVEVERGSDQEPMRYTCRFLYMCAGYFSYARGYTPEFAGLERFKGRVVHPQQWTDDIDFEGRRVLVIGSGATAVTLVPELSRKAAHVTMLQRSPSYLTTRPAEDKLASMLGHLVPEKLAYSIIRLKFILLQMFTFKLARRWPAVMKRYLRWMLRKDLGPEFDIATHFTPRYDPWQQRLCIVPDGDFFAAMRAGKASVVTDHIANFTEKGVALESGGEIEADLIVTATGLDLQMLGGLELIVDGAPTDVSQHLHYKGIMFSDIPNLASCFGYINASWTLKADLSSEYICRLLRHMDKVGAQQCTPRLAGPAMEREPFVDLSSGYFNRAAGRLPKQGSKRPWKLHQDYARDLATLRFGRIADGILAFSERP